MKNQCSDSLPPKISCLPQPNSNINNPMKTEQLTLEFLEQMTDPYKFKSFKVKLKDGALPKIKLRKTAIYTVKNVYKPSKFYKTHKLTIGNNSYNADMFRLVSELDHSVTDETINPFEPTKPNPDNQTVNTLVQYVSEHKDSMSKDSIRHFASLIGLIKLGAI